MKRTPGSGTQYIQHRNNQKEAINSLTFFKVLEHFYECKVEKYFVGGILHSTLSSGVVVGEMDIILISSLWEGFDREVRHCPSREDKIN